METEQPQETQASEDYDIGLDVGFDYDFDAVEEAFSLPTAEDF